MTSNEPQPLWREVVGDTEPWRRGRIAVIIFGILTFLDHCLVFGADLLHGNIQHLLTGGTFALLFWIQFYFIWIGIHWVRWVNAGFSGLLGFAFLIWGFRNGSALQICSGIYLFVTASYIGLAPAVYFFAQRQRETVRGLESAIVGGVMFLLLASCIAGAFGLSAYRAHRGAEARDFADRAFRRIFQQHDGDFLISHSTPNALENDGQLRWRIMMTDLVMKSGQIREITPSQGRLRYAYVWPTRIVWQGRMFAEAVADDGRILLQLDFVDAGAGWQIGGVWWRYR